MWPWEHLAVGFLLYWVLVRLRADRSRVGDGAAVAVAVGTQFPDLVDKPMAWVFGVFPSGVSVAHSVFVATALSVTAVAVARARGSADVGTAFAVGYLSHLPADLLYPVLIGEPPLFRAFVWPLATAEGPVRRGLLENFSHYFFRFVEFLFTARGALYLAAEALLLLTALLAWAHDGYPGLRWLFRERRTQPASG
ncbi:MAG: metal-dependent hydrolase [Haloarculaceae archaeon]